MSTNTDGGAPAFPASEEALMRNLQGLTAREYAAIKLRVPDSGAEWLDAMIRKSMRDELAAKAMQGLLANPELATVIEKRGGAHGGWIDTSAYGWADGMLKARDA